jgi:hypothetical protein
MQVKTAVRLQACSLCSTVVLVLVAWFYIIYYTPEHVTDSEVAVTCLIVASVAALFGLMITLLIRDSLRKSILHPDREMDTYHAV